MKISEREHDKCKQSDGYDGGAGFPQKIPAVETIAVGEQKSITLNVCMILKKLWICSFHD